MELLFLFIIGISQGGQLSHMGSPMASGTLTPGIAGPSGQTGSSSDRKRMDRKRRTMAADAAIAAAQGLPPGINVSQMTRDERRALGNGS